MRRPDTHELGNAIRRARTYGEVHFVVEPCSAMPETDPISVLDDFSERHGFNQISGAWREVSRDFAEHTLQRLLAYDLAYGAALMRDDRAHEFVIAFFELLLPDAQFYTNYRVLDDEDATLDHMCSYSSTPLTDATFDAGIIALDARHLALLWFSDED